MLHDRLRLVLLVPIALGAALVIAGFGGLKGQTGGASQPVAEWSTAGCEFTREPESIAVGDVTMPATPAALDEAIGRIDQGGRDRYAGSYAGIEVDQPRVRAVVYRVPSADFDEFIRDTAGGTCIVVRDARHSSADLATWHDRVLADLPFWTARGIRIVTIGAQHDGGALEIGTLDLDRARLELPARYGSRAPLVFVEQEPVRPLSSSR